MPPTSTPAPLPAAYRIESLDWDIRGAEGDKIAVQFTLKIANEGEARGEDGTPVHAEINGGASMEVAVVPSLGGGESTTVVFDLRLDPGQQQVRLDVDASDSLVALDLLASDVEVAVLHYQVVADGQVSVRVRLSNHGTLPTRPVQLIALNDLVATVQPIEARRI